MLPTSLRHNAQRNGVQRRTPWRNNSTHIADAERYLLPVRSGHVCGSSASAGYRNRFVVVMDYFPGRAEVAGLMSEITSSVVVAIVVEAIAPQRGPAQYHS